MEEKNEQIIEERSDSMESSYLLNIDNNLKKEAQVLCLHLNMSLKDFINLAVKELVEKKQKELNIEKGQK